MDEKNKSKKRKRLNQLFLTIIAILPLLIFTSNVNAQSCGISCEALFNESITPNGNYSYNNSQNFFNVGINSTQINIDLVSTVFIFFNGSIYTLPINCKGYPCTVSTVLFNNIADNTSVFNYSFQVNYLNGSTQLSGVRLIQLGQPTVLVKSVTVPFVNRSFSLVGGITGEYDPDKLCNEPICTGGFSVTTGTDWVCFKNFTGNARTRRVGNNVTINGRFLSEIAFTDTGVPVKITINGSQAMNKCIPPNFSTRIEVSAPKPVGTNDKWSFVVPAIGLNIDPIWYGESINYSSNPANYYIVQRTLAANKTIASINKGFIVLNGQQAWNITEAGFLNLRRNNNGDTLIYHLISTNESDANRPKKNTGNWSHYINVNMINFSSGRGTQIIMVNQTAAPNGGEWICNLAFFQDVAGKTYKIARDGGGVNVFASGVNLSWNITVKQMYDSTAAKCYYYAWNNTNGVLLGSAENIAPNQARVYNGSMLWVGGDASSFGKFSNIYGYKGDTRPQRPNTASIVFPTEQYVFNTSLVYINWTATPGQLQSILFMNGTLNLTNTTAGNYTINLANGIYNATIYAHDGYEGSGTNSTSIQFTVNVTVANTCTCPAINTNWQVDFKDNCVVSSRCDLGAGNISFINTSAGNFYIQSVLSVNRYNKVPADCCKITINGEGLFNITKIV